MPPWSWVQAEALLDAIEAEEVVDLETLNPLRQQLDNLFDRPADEWFSHSSLEIGDSLNDHLRGGLESLARDLGSVSALLDQARQMPEAMASEQSQQLQQALADALQRLELGTLPPRQDLLSSLQNIDSSMIRQMSAEDWQRLQQQLDNCRSSCATLASDANGGQALSSFAVVSDSEMESFELREGMDFTSDPNQLTPLTLRPDATDGAAGLHEGLPLANEITGLPLDSMGVRLGEHSIDETPFRPLQDRPAVDAGSGGDTVWRSRLTPEERRRLEAYFQ